jgi:hypothetical protein
MGDEVRDWTTVGSAGTLNAADLAKVSLDNAVITLGRGILPPQASAAEDPSIVLPEVSAVVRYNITAVDGLFPTTEPFGYVLELTYRGKVRARLAQFDRSSDTETDLLHFDSANFEPVDGFATNASLAGPPVAVMDFANCAYYVEATLTASAIVVGNPAEIAVVRVFASTEI